MAGLVWPRLSAGAFSGQGADEDTAMPALPDIDAGAVEAATSDLPDLGDLPDIGDAESAEAGGLPDLGELPSLDDLPELS